MAKAKQKQELTADASFEAFERLLTIQSESLQELAAAEGNTVATQVAKVKAINNLREAFDEAAIPAVMKIAGTAIGFRTDKDTDAGTTAYSTEIIREVCIEAMLSGLELLGNQFNIIAGRMYTTLEGYQHKLASLDYVTDLDIAVGNPEDVEVQEQEKTGETGDTPCSLSTVSCPSSQRAAFTASNTRRRTLRPTTSTGGFRYQPAGKTNSRRSIA